MMILSNFARFCRKVDFPGKDRLLRLLYSPDRRCHNYVTEIIPYDGGLIRVNTDSLVEWYLYFNEYYESHVTKTIKNVVKADSVCLDIGANIGCHTLTMAHQATHGKIYAFEPNPKSFERLMFNINLNKLANVTAYNVAISSDTGESSLFVPDDQDCNKGKCSMVLSRQRGLTHEIKINSTRIADVPEMNELDRCDFIKIDVEGYEPVCITELLDIINKFCPIIVFEYDTNTWKPAHASLQEVFQMLEKYSIRDLIRNQPVSLGNGQKFSGDIICIPK
jgi:FkbM family methyltransferase